MFRKNYVPKGDIYKCAKTGKYFFRGRGDLPDVLCFESGKYRLLPLSKAVMFNSIEEVVETLYQIACEEHKEQIFEDLEYSGSISV